jgi:NAD(P)-dependent dehydrogenase (short-subunit alcohol dehydrogenase family)
MKDRVVLVTGASRGIGAAIAERLAVQRTRCIGIQYRARHGDARSVASRIEAAGVAVALLPIDLSDRPYEATRDLATAFLDQVELTTGRREVHVIVNNVGASSHSEFVELSDSRFQVLANLNLATPMFLIQALLPHLAANGRIINISTGLTRVAAPYQVAYVALKAALNSMTLSLAPVLAERNATINAVLPGYVDTERMVASYAAGRRERLERLSVFNQIGTPDDVAQVVQFLASESSRWVTGQLIDATGGSGLLGGLPYPET